MHQNFQKACSHSVAWEFYSLKSLHRVGGTGPARDTSFWGRAAGGQRRHRHLGEGLRHDPPAHGGQPLEQMWEEASHTHDFGGEEASRESGPGGSCACPATLDSGPRRVREETLWSRQSFYRGTIMHCGPSPSVRPLAH